MEGMVKRSGKHQRMKQTGKDSCWKVFDLDYLLFYAQTVHELHNLNASFGQLFKHK